MRKRKRRKDWLVWYREVHSLNPVWRILLGRNTNLEADRDLKRWLSRQEDPSFWDTIVFHFSWGSPGATNRQLPDYDDKDDGWDK